MSELFANLWVQKLALQQSVFLYLALIFISADKLKLIHECQRVSVDPLSPRCQF